MAMRQTVHGYLNDKGEIEIDLPENWQPGEIQVLVPVKDDTPESDWENQPWTEEELKEMLTFRPSTMGEILKSGLVGSGADLEIEDSAEYVEKLRRNEEEQRRKQWMG